MPVAWHFLVRQLSALSIGMISLGLYSILCRTYWSITYVHQGYRGWRGYSVSYCAGLKILSLCLDLFCLCQGPVDFLISLLVLAIALTCSCKTGFLLSFDLIAGLVTWGVGCFSVIALCAHESLTFLLYAQPTQSCVAERYCVMLTAPAFVSPWLYSRLLFLSCHYETTPAHAFLVSDSIAGLVTWGGGCCSVGLYFCIYCRTVSLCLLSSPTLACSWQSAAECHGVALDVPVLDPSDDVADCCWSRCYKNFACSCFPGFKKSHVDVHSLLVLISCGVGCWALNCFSAIYSAECCGVAQTATVFALSWTLQPIIVCLISCKITPALAFLVSVNLMLASAVILLWIVASPTISFSLFWGIIPTVGNLRPFASDLIEEWTIGTSHLYKLRVPLLLLIWVVACGDCWSVCLLLTEPVIALLDSAAECCLFLYYKTIRLILCSLFWRLFFLLASPALWFQSHCRVGYWNFTFVQTARAFAVLDLTAGVVVRDW